MSNGSGNLSEVSQSGRRQHEVTPSVSDAYLVDRMTETIRAVRAEGKRPRIAVFVNRTLEANDKIRDRGDQSLEWHSTARTHDAEFW